jgi:RsiW-degrading membrane proteinase PrsW (M82 family)
MKEQVLTVTATVVPSILLLWYIHSRDRFPEPGRIVWTTFVLGIFSALFVVMITIPMHFFLPGFENPIAAGMKRALLHAAIPEESCKLMVLVFYCMRRSEFDEQMDGFVYGVTASLGFATLENILYVAGGGLNVALMRAVTAVPAHAMFGAVMGYFAALSLFVPRRRRAYLFMAWLFPVVLHGLYDFPLMSFSITRSGVVGIVQVIGIYVIPIAVLIGGWCWVVRLSGRVRTVQEERASG